MQLVTWEGLSLTVFNESKCSFDHSWQIKGFETLEQAKEYKSRIMSSWGYCPSAKIEQQGDDIVVSCSMANSCD